jgi:hypothetical protein
MAAHAPPPPEVYEHLVWLGAGSALRDWATSRAPGESNADFYIEHPACYVLLGHSGAGYGGGFEDYRDAMPKGADEIETQLSHWLRNPAPAAHDPQPLE